MKISIKAGGQVDPNKYESTQDVDFVYVFGTKNSQIESQESYEDLIDTSRHHIIAALNYSVDPADEQYAYENQGISDENVNLYKDLSIFKREIWNDNGVAHSEKMYHPIAINSEIANMKDFNVLNNRDYEYIVYYSEANDPTNKLYFNGHVKTKWTGWTLTELHETGEKNKYYASDKDVWKFKYNVSIGETQHQFAKTQQDNLSAYPSFSIGPKKNLSGSVTCYLGEDVLLSAYTVEKYEYALNTTTNKWEWVLINGDRLDNVGGYREWRNGEQVTSNKQVDMLNNWREFCFSGNPKLLRDQKGNGYIVQITDSSDKAEETWDRMPVSISFSWVQIGDAKDCIILGD